MIAVLTGDIIDSSHHDKALWLPHLRAVLETQGKEGEDFEIYRGDEFQLRLSDPTKALEAAICIKARLIARANTGIRIAIGLGEAVEPLEQGAPLTLNSGPAFIRSGRKLDELKAKKIHLGILSMDEQFDLEWNLIIQWILLTADNWSSVLAEIVELALLDPTRSQMDMASLLEVKQSAVSQRLKRASFDLLSQTLSLFDQKIGALCKISNSR